MHNATPYLDNIVTWSSSIWVLHSQL